MGYSTAYTIFGGFAEVLPAILLVFRRTVLLGSLIAFAVMLNVVVMNFCYDVPVKLLSLNLLLLATFLVAPNIPRLYRFFVMNNSTEPSTFDGSMFPPGRARGAANLLKFSLLTIFIGGILVGSIKRYRKVTAQPTAAAFPLTTRGFHWSQEEPYNR